MSWCLFLDDERFPESSVEDEDYRRDRGMKPFDGIVREWTVIRTTEDAVAAVRERGMPSFIAFDHDLTHDTPNGHEFAKALVEMALDGDIEFPEDFAYEVHSWNVAGSDNIRGTMDGFIRHLENEKAALNR